RRESRNPGRSGAAREGTSGGQTSTPFFPTRRPGGRYRRRGIPRREIRGRGSEIPRRRSSGPPRLPTNMKIGGAFAPRVRISPPGKFHIGGEYFCAYHNES